MNDATRTQIRLLALVMVAFLPAVVLFGLANSNLRQHEREQQEDQLVQIATLAALEYERLIKDSHQLLSVLAEFPEIRIGSSAECGRRLASVLSHTPQFTTLSLIGADGYMTCGSLPVDGSLYLGDRAYYLLATTNGQFSVGEYALGRITGKPTVGVAFPLASEPQQRVQKVLAASLDLSNLGSYSPRTLPAYVTFTVLDRNGRVLVRKPAGHAPIGNDSLGAQAPENFPQLPAEAGGPELMAGTDLDGVSRLFAIAPLRGGGLRPQGYVVVGKEEVMLLAEMESAASRELRFLGLAGGALVLLTWLLGHYGLVRAGARTRAEPG
ncbi:MAG TPA: cache domain-containing protein [Longimicrobiales bacterium]|nr:cache domain-containing protein [Longimicrobiales bacterium]